MHNGHSAVGHQSWLRPQGSKREGMSSRSAPAVRRCDSLVEKPTQPRHCWKRRESISLPHHPPQPITACPPHRVGLSLSGV